MNNLKKTIILEELNALEKQQLLQSCITPRPIALVSSINADGQVNLSPFSFFNIFGTNPPLVIISPNNRLRDNTPKHTLLNILSTKEFAVSMVDFEMSEQMSLSSSEYSETINEYTKAGFTPSKSKYIKPPYVLESKISLECKLLDYHKYGDGGGSANLLIGEILAVHIDQDLLDDKNYIDQSKLDFVARLGGDHYARIDKNSIFTMPKPNVKLGIGFENLPPILMKSNLFTKNELARLASIEYLPNSIVPSNFIQDVQEIKNLIASNKINEAWYLILKN